MRHAASNVKKSEHTLQVRRLGKYNQGDSIRKHSEQFSLKRMTGFADTRLVWLLLQLDAMRNSIR